MLFGRNVIPKFNGKKANWPRFIPAFNAVVDNKYPRLPDVNINLKTWSVDLLIDQVCPTLLHQLEARGKEDTEPYAFRTPRGRQFK